MIDIKKKGKKYIKLCEIMADVKGLLWFIKHNKIEPEMIVVIWNEEVD